MEWPDGETMDATRSDALDGYQPSSEGVASCRICGAWYAIVKEETLPAGPGVLPGEVGDRGPYYGVRIGADVYGWWFGRFAIAAPCPCSPKTQSIKFGLRVILPSRMAPKLLQIAKRHGVSVDCAAGLILQQQLLQSGDAS
jgi:hypothetical protein